MYIYLHTYPYIFRKRATPPWRRGAGSGGAIIYIYIHIIPKDYCTDISRSRVILSWRRGDAAADIYVDVCVCVCVRVCIYYIYINSI